MESTGNADRDLRENYTGKSVSELQDKIKTLNDLARKRSSISKRHDEQGIRVDRNTDDSEREISLDQNHKPLLDLKSNLMTESSRRIQAMFEKYLRESNGEHESQLKLSSQKKHGSQMEMKREENRKAAIESMEKNLQNHSSRYISRCANSLRYKIPRESDTQNQNHPIPIQENEMNPKLFLKLSCEKICVDVGKRILRIISLHDTSQQIFIHMYWLMHCRFFQSNSGAEQRYLLEKVAQMFPQFIEATNMIAPSKHSDSIYRYYPFVLAKAIGDGFTFLCPGNPALFKGTFQRLLYLSIFRLFTGLNLCPASIDAQRLKMFPDDAEEDECNSKSANAAVHTQKNHRNENNVKNRSETKTIPRQQQNQFDAHQISPLLQNCLKRQRISNGRKHILSRTEPTPNCRSGGVETYHSLAETIDLSLCDQDSHKEIIASLTRDLEKIKYDSRKQFFNLKKDRKNVLSGGTKSVAEFTLNLLKT